MNLNDSINIDIKDMKTYFAPILCIFIRSASDAKSNELVEPVCAIFS